MGKISEVLTEERLEAVRGMCIYDGYEMKTIIPGDKPTEENFVAIELDTDNAYRAKDFVDDDDAFKYVDADGNEYTIDKIDMPEAVVEMLESREEEPEEAPETGGEAEAAAPETEE